MSGSLLASVIAGILIFLLLIGAAPDAVPFSPNNYGWNGIQQVASSFPITFVDSPALAKVSPQNRTVLLILQPILAFDNNDAEAILSFAEHGGILVVSDSSGVSNLLLHRLGLGVSIEQNLTIRDDTYNWKASSFPIALTSPGSISPSLFSGTRGIALDNPSPLLVNPGSGASVVAFTSPVSVALEWSNGHTGAQVARGPFPVVVEESVGSGSVVVISDSYFLTNGVWKYANNEVLIRHMLSNSTVYLDTSHWPPNTIASIRADLGAAYALLSAFPLRYLLTLALVGVGLSLIPIFSAPAIASPRVGKSSRKQGSALDETGYDAEILRRIRKDRERYGRPK